VSRLVLPLVLLVLLLVAIVALDEPRPRADLVVAGGNEVFTLDPQRMSYLADMRLAYALYEGLLRWNTDDFSLEPAAAEDWTVSDDGQVLEFTLRSDGRWSDGSPVTAHDFAWSWMRLLLPDTAADYSNLFFSIEGAGPFWDWRQRQLDGFSMDPWNQKTPENRTRAVQGLLHRFDALRNAKELPGGIAWHVLDSDQMATEQEALQAAIDSEQEDRLLQVLEQSDVLQAMHRRLDDPDSKAVEALWMWNQVEPRFESQVAIDVIDDHQLTIRLDRPVPYFADLLAFAPSSPVNRPAVEGWSMDETMLQDIRLNGWHAAGIPSLDQRLHVDISPDTGRLVQSHRWARPGAMVNNGPYQLDEWRYKRDMRLSKSPDFHDPELAGFETIEIRSIPDPNTAVLAFLKGEVDWLTGVAADCRIDMLEQQRPDIHAIPVFGTDFFSFNCRPRLADGRPNPFSDAAVRRGFAMATDKQTIVDNVTRLREPVASTLVPANSIKGYESPEGLPFDPESARASLAEAGWLDRDGDGRPEDSSGRPFPDVELLYTTGNPRFSRMAVELREQWQRHLGIPVVLLGQDTKFFKDDLRKGNFMVARGRWYGDYGDPTTFLELCRSTDGNNDRGFANDEVDAALKAAANEPDRDRRLQDLALLEERLFQQDLPLIPVCQLVDITMYDPAHLSGVTHHPRLTHYFWKLRPAEEMSGQ